MPHYVVQYPEDIFIQHLVQRILRLPCHEPDKSNPRLQIRSLNFRLNTVLSATSAKYVRSLQVFRLSLNYGKEEIWRISR